MFVLILSLIFSLLIAIFALQNASLVTIQLFWVTKDVPLVLVILGSAFTGAVIMLLLAIWRELRIKLSPQQPLQGENPKDDLSAHSADSSPKQSDQKGKE